LFPAHKKNPAYFWQARAKQYAGATEWNLHCKWQFSNCLPPFSETRISGT